MAKIISYGDLQILAKTNLYWASGSENDLPTGRDESVAIYFPQNK